MISKRIEELINHFSNGNKSLFSKQIGVTPSVVGNITGERKGNPSFEVICKIIYAFADINANWLITGDGDMLKRDLETNVKLNQSDAEKDALISYLEKTIEKKDVKIETQAQEIALLKEKIARLEAVNNTPLFKIENIDQSSLFKSPDVTPATARSKKASKTNPNK